jgi:hypothetical protein
MSRHTPRTAGIIARAAGCRCEALERRALLSLTPEGDEFRANSFTASQQNAAAIAVDADGDFVLAWQSYAQDGSNYGIFAQRYNAAGVGQGAEFRVNTFTAGSQRFADVAMDADGDFVITWDSPAQDGSSTGIYGRRYNSAGVAQGSEFRVNTFTTGEQLLPAVAMDASGDFVVAWQGVGSGDDYGVYAQRYNALGTAQGGEFRVNTFTTGSQRNLALAMDADGDLVIAWTSSAQDPDGSSGVYARRYDLAGAAQGGEFRVNTTTPGNQKLPAVALDASGDFVVAWTSAYDIFAQRYNAAGLAQGGELRANTFTGGFQDSAAAGMDADGNFLITWTDGAFGNGQEGSLGVYAQYFNAAGAPQGGELRVNTFTTGNQSTPDVAMESDGDAVVAWQSNGQDGSGYGVYAQRYAGPDTVAPVVVDVFVGGVRVVPYTSHEPAVAQIVVTFSEDMSAAGGPSGANSVTNPANWLITHDGNDIGGGTTITYGIDGTGLRFQAVLNLPNPVQSGNLLIMPRDNLRDIAGNRLDGDLDGAPGGHAPLPFSVAPFGPKGDEFRVNTFTTGTQGGRTIAMDADGDFVIAWSSDQGGPPFGVYAQRFNASGTPQGAEFRVNPLTTGAGSPSIAMDDAGNFVVVWGSSDGSGLGIFGRRFNALGMPLGGEFRVNTFTPELQQLGAVAMGADGHFVVTWHSFFEGTPELDIAAQRFDASGVPLGGEIRVTSTPFPEFGPTVATDDGGNFVIAWNSLGSGDVHARRYAASGAPLGAEFRVNSFTTGSQGYPSAAMDADGDFVIAWEGRSREDPSDGNIFAQRFNASGTAQGGELVVNALTTGGQSFATAAMDADGDFVIAWEHGSRVVGENADINARRFDRSGNPQSGDFLVNTETIEQQILPAAAMSADGDFVIAWQSKHAGSSDVYAQRYGRDRTPSVAALADTPDPVVAGNAVSLSATGVVDNQAVASVSFYREANGLSGLQVGFQGDLLVGTDTTPSAGAWSVIAPTSALGNGTYRYWAQARDDAGLIGQPASTTNTVTGAPAPAVAASEFLFATLPQRLRFTFNQDVSASLTLDDLVVTALPGGPTVTPRGLTYDHATNTATVTFGGVLPDARYRATVQATGVTSPGGTPMTAHHVFEFTFLRGDANGDGRVNLADFNILAANFGQSPRDFTQGDFDYSGNVNLTDFNILAARFGAVLGPAARGPAGGRTDADEELSELLRELT